MLPLFDRRHHARTVQAGAQMPMHGGADRRTITLALS